MRTDSAVGIAVALKGVCKGGDRGHVRERPRRPVAQLICVSWAGCSQEMTESVIWQS